MFAGLWSLSQFEGQVTIAGVFDEDFESTAWNFFFFLTLYKFELEFSSIFKWERNFHWLYLFAQFETFEDIDSYLVHFFVGLNSHLQQWINAGEKENNSVFMLLNFWCEKLYWLILCRKRILFILMYIRLCRCIPRFSSSQLSEGSENLGHERCKKSDQNHWCYHVSLGKTINFYSRHAMAFIARLTQELVIDLNLTSTLHFNWSLWLFA